MARKPTGKPVGRPEKPIDWAQFEQLCALHCTQDEIGNMLGLAPVTVSIRVRDHYREEYLSVYKRFQEQGKCSLRRNQFVLSKKNASMAIWLGKVLLGQKDPGIDETKEDVKHALLQAVREIRDESRIATASRSSLENKQLVLDQERRGETPEIST
jgi:hypothetical protein